MAMVFSRHLSSAQAFKILQLVEKVRCILPLPNLFPSLARRFACSQSCSVSLRTLWAYGSGESHPERAWS